LNYSVTFDFFIDNGALARVNKQSFLWDVESPPSASEQPSPSLLLKAELHHFDRFRKMAKPAACGQYCFDAKMFSDFAIVVQLKGSLRINRKAPRERVSDTTVHIEEPCVRKCVWGFCDVLSRFSVENRIPKFFHAIRTESEV